MREGKEAREKAVRKGRDALGIVLGTKSDKAKQSSVGERVKVRLITPAQ